MISKRGILVGLAAAAILAVGAAYAGNTSFVTGIGDVTFPFTPPTAAGAAGAIDNMVIGATTPRAATFSSGPTINGDASTLCATYYFTGTPAATNQVFFLATRAMLVTSISEVHSAAAGGASKLQVTLDTSTNAPAAGTSLLTNNTNAGFDLAATANTVQAGTLVAAGSRTMAAGDRLAVKFANAIQSSAGVVVTACGQPI